jgi:hypothetical protein
METKFSRIPHRLAFIFSVVHVHRNAFPFLTIANVSQGAANLSVRVRTLHLLPVFGRTTQASIAAAPTIR